MGEQCHYVGHLNALKSSLTVEENATFWCRFLGGRRDGLDAALAAFGLAALRDIPAAYLSAGQKRRLGLARLLLRRAADLAAGRADRLARHAPPRRRSPAPWRGISPAGGLVIAATHVPLGLPKARELHLGGTAEAA